MANTQLVILDGPIIRAGESLSEPMDCSVGLPVRITMPQEWTSARLTFSFSSDGDTYQDVFTFDGQELQINVMANTCIPVPEQYGRMLGFMKIRSGPRDKPVPQEAERHFRMALTRAASAMLMEDDEQHQTLRR